jgi:hypothetical protein
LLLLEIEVATLSLPVVTMFGKKIVISLCGCVNQKLGHDLYRRFRFCLQGDRWHLAGHAFV